MALAVHAHDPDQVEMAALFGAGGEVDKFAPCAWHPGPYGLPVIDDCAAWTLGPVVERCPSATMSVTSSSPREGGGSGGGPVLGFHQVHHLQPGHPA
jgi:hypothetical protein